MCDTTNTFYGAVVEESYLRLSFPSNLPPEEVKIRSLGALKALEDPDLTEYYLVAQLYELGIPKNCDRFQGYTRKVTMVNEGGTIRKVKGLERNVSGFYYLNGRILTKEEMIQEELDLNLRMVRTAKGGVFQLFEKDVVLSTEE